MMNLVIRRVAPALLVTLVGIAAPANGFGGTVDIGLLLGNPGFEAGNQPVNPGDQVGCPVSWTCSGSPTPGATAYVVTADQYVAGADGLSGGLIVPCGKWSATMPTKVEGSGFLSQSRLGTYMAGMTYVLNLWVGTPLTVPLITPITPAGKVARVTFYFLGNSNGQMQANDIAAPAPGQWKLVTLSFTPVGNQVGQSIGVGLFVDSGGNNQVINHKVCGCTCR